MILIKKIEIGVKDLEDSQVSRLEDCYLIVSTADNTHFCRTVPFLGGRLNWCFNREAVRLSRNDKNMRVNLKIVGY
jgi:hypothetical protein